MKLSLEKTAVPITLTEGIADTAVNAFTQADYTNLTQLPHAPETAELKELLAETRILGIRSRTKITAEILDAAPRLIALGCFCIGTNQVDLSAARNRGIPVFNAPFSNTRSVAELTVCAIIALLRGIPEKNALLHRGEWQKSAQGANEARGKALGIVGYGNIGAQVSVLADALGMQVYYFDTASKLPHGTAQPVDSLTALYEVADVITYHVPETPETIGMVDTGALAQMKPGVKLINYARGSLINIPALCEALEAKKVSGVALDVYPDEPEQNGPTFTSPLCQYDNILLTPHIGGSTQEAQANIGREVAHKLVTYSDNGSTIGAVNFPEVNLPLHSGAHRILNIHQNIPGMLSQINAIFSDAGANILGQFLQTQSDVGYVVVDIDDTTSTEEIQTFRTKLQELSGSLRTRILH